MTDETSQNMSDEEKTQSDLSNEILKDLCTNNAEYFSKDNTENGQRLFISFTAIKEEISSVWPIVLGIERIAHRYDFDEKTKANGYRSFLSIMKSAINYGMHINKKVCLKRDSVLFRKAVITKEVEACAQLFASLHTCFKHLEEVLKNSPKDELFASNCENVHEMITKTDDVNQYCFYGRPLGFQFAESMRAPLRFISLSMAIFAEAYYNDGSLFAKATNSFMTTTKFVSDPEQRAKRVVNICQNADVNFCKSFWFLSESELMQYLPSIVAPNVAICKVISIPTEPISLNVQNKEIDIPIPSSHIGSKPVHVRLISCEAREGMIGEGKNTKMSPPSRGLVIHCHGGGFIAQSSKSHEAYLRQWARDLHVPILSIDYSLAPNAPYPRALEEVFYAYSWAIKNCHLLGSTGERIVAAGDSAGANLLTCMSFKCTELGVPKPHGLFLAYMPTFLNFIPSPARLLTKMDPLLPFGFLTNCIKAYLGIGKPSNGTVNGERPPSPDTESFEEISESDLLELQAHKSPTSEMSDTLTYGSLTSQTDDTPDPSTIKDPDIDFNSSDADASQKFDLLDKFVLDSDTDTDGTKIAVITKETVNIATNESLTIEKSVQGKVSKFVTKWRGKMSNLVNMTSMSNATTFLDIKQENTCDFLKEPFPIDPYLSPLCASDALLKELPPIKILTVHLDPCLDDCVSFAKKLKTTGNVISLDVLEGLPHGFLNFSLVCKEAYEASKICAQKIGELLDLDSLPPPITKT